MNRIERRRIVIEYSVWHPFMEAVQKDVDNILHLKKENKLLPNAGHVTIRFEELGLDKND